MRTLRDVVSLKDIVLQLPFDTTTQGDIHKAVGDRRYFFRDEIPDVKNAVFAESYKRLAPPIVEEEEISLQDESIYDDIDGVAP